MKKYLLIEIIIYLFFSLLVYTGVNKLIDHDTFVSALNKSPWLRTYSGFLSYAIPLIEIIIAVVLISGQWRSMAFYSVFALMLSFTVYIALMLLTIKPGKELPCSCGGIIQEMSWKQHLVFNILMTSMAYIGIRLNNRGPEVKMCAAGNISELST